MSIVRDLLTGRNGISHDLGRYSWVGSWAAVTAVAGWHEFHGVAVDLTTLATAYATTAAAHGVALFAKQQTEPPGS